MEYEHLLGNLNDALAELRYLIIREDFLEINEALRCTAGGYGDVYRATLRELGSVNRAVAVKELRPVGDDVTRIRSAIRLTRELRVWARLEHPNVLELVGYYLNPQMTTSWLISPFMTNGNIDEYLVNAPEQDSDSLRLKLLRDSLKGLIYLHTFGPPICHADIKPDNALITDQVEAVLCDFGLARLTDGQPSGLTTSKTVKGSTRYMSPELLEEDAVHTLRSDVWAYGCLVLKVMTRSTPYAKARTDPQIILALATKKSPADLTALEVRDGRLKTLLAKCWNTDPAARPSATECLHYITKPRTTELQLNPSSVAQNIPYLERFPSPPGNSVSDPTPSFHELEAPPLPDKVSKATINALIPPVQAEPSPPDSPPKPALPSEYARPAGTFAPLPDASKVRIGPKGSTASFTPPSFPISRKDFSPVASTRNPAGIMAPQYPSSGSGSSRARAASRAEGTSQAPLPSRHQPSPLRRSKDTVGSRLLQVQLERTNRVEEGAPNRDPVPPKLQTRNLFARRDQDAVSREDREPVLRASSNLDPNTTKFTWPAWERQQQQREREKAKDKIRRPGITFADLSG